MKVLIWLLTFVVGSMINTAIGYATGIKAGAVLLYIGEYFVAKTLCNKWDEHVAEKEERSKSITQNTNSNHESKTIIKDSISASGNNPNQNRVSQTPLNRSEATQQYVPEVCPHCGFKLLENSAFCSSCGYRIPGVEAVIVPKEPKLGNAKDTEKSGENIGTVLNQPEQKVQHTSSTVEEIPVLPIIPAEFFEDSADFEQRIVAASEPTKKGLASENPAVEQTAEPIKEKESSCLDITEELQQQPAKLRRAFIFLEDGKWDKADEYLEAILDEDPENPLAYIGKIMLELKLNTPDELLNKGGQNSEYFKFAVRYADEKLKRNLTVQ